MLLRFHQLPYAEKPAGISLIQISAKLVGYLLVVRQDNYLQLTAERLQTLLEIFHCVSQLLHPSTKRRQVP